MSADPLLLGLAPRQPVPSSPRSPLLAAALSLFCPGLGHLYCGMLWRALAWSLVPYLVMIALMGLGVFWLPGQLHRFVLAAVAGWAILRLVQVPAAALRARAEQKYTLRSFNAFWLYLAFFLGTSVFTSLVLRPWRAYVIEPFKVPSVSMEPTLGAGDELFVLKVGPGAVIHRFDVIVHRATSGSAERVATAWVKRVVGLPGETVELREGVVYVNGAPMLHQPCIPNEDRCVLEAGHRILLDELHSARGNFPPTLVPSQNYFVLGDNRANSADSREEGPLPFEDVVGRASVIWLSLADGLKIRWDRIGLQL